MNTKYKLLIFKFLSILCKLKKILPEHSPRSKIKGALGPISIATAPTPPVGLAFPVAYTAISPATTRAYRPDKYYLLVYKKVIDTLTIIHTN